MQFRLKINIFNLLLIFSFLAIIYGCPPKKPIKPDPITPKPIKIDSRKVNIDPEIVAAMLDELGYYGEGAPYSSSYELKRSLKKFQKDIGYPQTGVLDMGTWNKISQVNLSSSRKQEINKQTLIKFAQETLIMLGYDPGETSGALTEKTRIALEQFQRENGLKPTGAVDDKTKAVLIEQREIVEAKLKKEAAKEELAADEKAEKTNKVLKPKYKKPAKVKYVKPAIPKEKSDDKKGQLSKKKKSIAAPEYTLKNGDPVYILEKIECKNKFEVWLLFYKGKLVKLDKKKATVVVNERYGMMYDSRHEGISTEDWWCIPRKRFCYSTVKFSGWGGKIKPGQEFQQARKWAMPSQKGYLISLAQRAIKEKCKIVKTK